MNRLKLALSHGGLRDTREGGDGLFKGRLALPGLGIARRLAYVNSQIREAQVYYHIEIPGNLGAGPADPRHQAVQLLIELIKLVSIRNQQSDHTILGGSGLDGIDEIPSMAGQPIKDHPD